MSELSCIVRDISKLVQGKCFKEALELCKLHETTKHVIGSFLFWSIAGQCAVENLDWKLAERYLVAASKCDVPLAQQQKLFKVFSCANAKLY